VDIFRVVNHLCFWGESFAANLAFNTASLSLLSSGLFFLFSSFSFLSPLLVRCSCCCNFPIIAVRIITVRLILRLRNCQYFLSLLFWIFCFFRRSLRFIKCGIFLFGVIFLRLSSSLSFFLLFLNFIGSLLLRFRSLLFWWIFVTIFRAIFPNRFLKHAEWV